MYRIFTADSPYTKQARFLAWLWTLLVLAGCLTPGKDLPEVHVPFVDKWVHLVMFGGFAFLWLCARPGLSARRLTVVFLAAAGYGVLIELLQGALTWLGRSMDVLDAVADALGGLLGIGIFCMAARLTTRRP